MPNLNYPQSSLQLINRHILIILARHNRIRHLPDLDQVILRRTTDHPWIIFIPTKITDPVRMPTMHEQQFRRPILAVLGRLFFADAAQIPEDYSSVVGARAEDGGLEGMPLERGDRFVVALEGVQFEFEVAQVPDADGVVGAAGCDDAFGRGAEGDGVDGVAVLVGGGGDGGARGVIFACIEDLHGDVVRDAANQGRVQGVVLDVVDNGAVVGVCS